MKPIPLIPLTITLTPAPQPYLRVFVPKNTFGTLKWLHVEYGLIITVRAPNLAGGPLYQEGYQIIGMGSTPRFGIVNVTAVPSTTRAWFVRDFIWDGTNLYELNYDGSLNNYMASAPDGQDHRLRFLDPIAPFQPTQDNYIDFQLSTTFALSTDTVETFTGQAFIQSPLDLRRLTP